MAARPSEFSDPASLTKVLEKHTPMMAHHCRTRMDKGSQEFFLIFDSNLALLL